MGVGRVKRRRVFERDDYTCRYCSYDMTLHFAYPHLGVLTIDHIIPRVAGGTGRYDNLVTCCFDCNSRKDNRPVAEFLRDLYAIGVPPAGKAQQQLRWRAVRVWLIRDAAAEQAHGLRMARQSALR